MPCWPISTNQKSYRVQEQSTETSFHIPTICVALGYLIDQSSQMLPCIQIVLNSNLIQAEDDNTALRIAQCVGKKIIWAVNHRMLRCGRRCC